MEIKMRYLQRILVILILFVPAGCEKAAPQVQRINPEKAYPGSTLTITGEHFAKESTNSVVTVAALRAHVKNSAPNSLEVNLPAGLEAGSYDLVVEDRSTQKSSAPFRLNIIERIQVPVKTKLAVRTVDSIGSETNRAGDTFALVLDQPLVVDGRIVAEKGSQMIGRVTDVKQPGRVKGRAQIGFTLVELKRTATESLPLATDEFHTQAAGSQKRDALTIGLTTGIGTVLGAIAGGKKGAVIGATAGAAVGTGTVLLTRGNQIVIPANAEFHFHLVKPIEFEISEPLPKAGQ